MLLSSRTLSITRNNIDNKLQTINAVFKHMKCATFLIFTKLFDTTNSTTKNTIVGGARLYSSIDTRSPRTQEEEDTLSNSNLLKIGKGLVSEKIGLYNPSNSCYMNALIQALNGVTAFRQKVLEINNNNTQHFTLSTLKQIFAALQNKQITKDAVFIDLRDTEIYKLLGFEPNIQNDPREVITIMLDKLKLQHKHIAEMFEYTEVKEIFEHDNIVRT